MMLLFAEVRAPGWSASTELEVICHRVKANQIYQYEDAIALTGISFQFQGLPVRVAMLVCPERAARIPLTGKLSMGADHNKS